MASREQRLAAVAAHLDKTTPLLQSAYQSRDLIGSASEDRKLEALEQAYTRLRDRLADWVGKGYVLYHGIIKDPAAAAQHLRQYLEPVIGHQLRHPATRMSDDVPMHDAVAVWYMPPEPAHPNIVWWVAEGTAGEGDQLFHTADELPDQDDNIFQNIDPARAHQWFPPAWLHRTPDLYGKRQTALRKQHSPDSARRELAYIHWQIWDRVNDQIDAAVSVCRSKRRRR